MFIKEIFFVLSILSYFYLEKTYQTGIIISAINFFAILMFQSVYSIILAALLISAQIACIAYNLSFYANFAFMTLAVIFPLLPSRVATNEKVVSKPAAYRVTQEPTITKTTSPVKVASVTPEKPKSTTSDTDDVVQKAKDSARKRELERRTQAARHALAHPSPNAQVLRSPS